LRLVGEAEEEDEDKALNAMGILRTIVTFIRFMDESPEIMGQLEVVFLPMIQTVLSRILLDYLEETLEIITTFTYCAKTISPTMWSVFPMLYDCFKKGAFDYFSDMLPCFDNYISRDPHGFVTNPQAVNLTLDVVQSVINSDTSGEIEQANGCKLIEVFLLNLPGAVDQLVPGFMELGYKLIPDAETTLLKVSAMEVLINAIYYNPLLALQVFESKGWTGSFFTAWFQSIDKFSRVHDLKLCILALCKLFQIPHDQIPPMIQAGYHQAMAIIIKLFEALPAAYQCKARSSSACLRGALSLSFSSLADRKELEELEDDDSDEEEDDEIADDDFEADAGDDDEDVFSEEDAAHLEALREKAKKEEDDFLEDDDVDLEEELESTTPLDDINEYVAFQETFKGLQTANPATFAALTSGLDAKQTQFLHQLNVTADQKRVELAQAAQQKQ